VNEQRAGLIGHPVAHSISPIFQQAAFDALHIAARYEAWDTPVAELPGRVARLREEPYLGANVTVPHKQHVLSLLDNVDPLALQAGAVNTIYKRGGRLHGANTDVEGFRRALREEGGYNAAGSTAVVLGAGGAAGAVVLALQLEGAASVSVANRHHERAERLVQELRVATGPRLATVGWERATSAAFLSTAGLMVNCTTLGMAGADGAAASPVSVAAMHSRLFVCDVVANPRLTPLLLAARKAGARTLGGLSMLVFQGAASFEIWTGHAAPVGVMKLAAIEAMRRLTAGESSVTVSAEG